MNNNFNDMLNMLNGASNPQQFIQTQIKNNPQLAQFQTQLGNMYKSSGMSEKEFALQYAKQNGIDVNQLQALANKLGLK